MTLHYSIYNGFWIHTEHSTKIYDVTAWRAIQSAMVAMYADGSGTGSSLRNLSKHPVGLPVYTVYFIPHHGNVPTEILQDEQIIIPILARYIHWE